MVKDNGKKWRKGEKSEGKWRGVKGKSDLAETKRRK